MPHDILQSCVLWRLRYLPSYHLVCTTVLCLGESCFFIYWQYGEIPDYSHYHQPHISLKMHHFPCQTKTLPQFWTDLNSYWFSASHSSFITLNFKQKDDNAIIHAWTLRGRQWPFELCRKFINGTDIGHGSCSACVVTLKGKHRSTWTNFVSRSGIRLSQRTSTFG
jgi:hypothetical protein